MKVAGITSFHMVLLFMGTTTILFIILRHHLPFLYMGDVKIARITASLLLIAAFFQLSDGMQVVGLGALRGLGDVKIPTAIALVSYWGIGLPIGYFLGFKLNFGVEGIWYGLLSGLTIAAFLLFFRFRRLCRINFNQDN